MARRPALSNGHSTNRLPGAYAHVLQLVCERDAHRSMDCVLILDDSELAEWDQVNAALVAALVRERTGKPVNAHSAYLPPGLPSPFAKFPVGGQRCFPVTP